MNETAISRFSKKVSFIGANGCWEWQGHRVSGGYGQFRTGGGGSPTVVAHKFAWVLAHGEIPVGMQLCHRCDNPSCVNPAHLFLGTAKDNAEDRERKGRSNWHLRSGEHWRTRKHSRMWKPAGEAIRRDALEEEEQP